MGIDFSSVKYPVWELGIDSLERSSDIHPHTSYTDGSQKVQQSLDEGLGNGQYEKGAIEHGNPLDDDIDHITGFLNEVGWGNPFSSSEVYTLKYQNLQEVMAEKDNGRVLNDADPRKVQEDINTLRKLERNGGHTGEETLNYKMIVPHGIELDYNPAIESAEDEQEAVDSYEEGLVDFLKEAESLNAGFNYILASSHYVNTPFRPRYVKKDGLFHDLDLSEKIDVLEHYRSKEIHKIESLSEKLYDLKVPRISGELMTSEEREELEAFVYGHEELQEDPVYPEGDFMVTEALDQSLDIERPGPIVVGAHPTLIERNEELLDVFRAEEGLTTRENIREEVQDFIYSTDISSRIDSVDVSGLHEDEVSTEDIDSLLTEDDLRHIYPGVSLQEYYRPMAAAAEEADNFIFEINGKGIERQTPSVFWYMLDENVFGSDAHRPDESPERVQAYSEASLPGDTVLLAEKWIERLESDEEEEIHEESSVEPAVKRLEA